jgi:hypothetical protein
MDELEADLEDIADAFDPDDLDGDGCRVLTQSDLEFDQHDASGSDVEGHLEGTSTRADDYDGLYEVRLQNSMPIPSKPIAIMSTTRDFRDVAEEKAFELSHSPCTKDENELLSKITADDIFSSSDSSDDDTFDASEKVMYPCLCTLLYCGGGKFARRGLRCREGSHSFHTPLHRLLRRNLSGSASVQEDSVVATAFLWVQE